jgi:hypothetical protein
VDVGFTPMDHSRTLNSRTRSDPAIRKALKDKPISIGIIQWSVWIVRIIM